MAVFHHLQDLEKGLHQIGPTQSAAGHFDFCQSSNSEVSPLTKVGILSLFFCRLMCIFVWDLFFYFFIMILILNEFIVP